MTDRLSPAGACYFTRTLLFVFMIGGVAACSDHSPTEYRLEPEFAQGGGGPPVRVTATDPTGAEQGTTLDVRILGSSFEPGSNAAFILDGTPGLVGTNFTTFVSQDELIANITVDAGADLGLYDVEVITPHGKKGVGTELFEIRMPGGKDQTEYVITDWQGAVWSAGPISAGIGLNGEFSFDAGGTAKNAPPELCVDLSQLVGGAPVDPANYDIFVQQVSEDPTSLGMAAVCSEVTVHTRDHSSNSATGQPVGTIEHAGGKIVLKDFFTRIKGRSTGDWQWRLHFDVELALKELPERGKGICIHHQLDTVWHVYNDDDLLTDPPSGCAAAGAAIDNVMRLTRFAGSDMILVAEFIVPFRFSFMAKP